MFSTRKYDILFNGKFNLKIMKESIVMANKTAIKPFDGPSLLVSWIFESKHILYNV